MYNCMTCNHPICPMKNKADHYCGNYVMKGERLIEKAKICFSNFGDVNCVDIADSDDNASDT